MNSLLPSLAFPLGPGPRPRGPEAMVRQTLRSGLVICFALACFGIVTRAAEEGLSEGSTFALGGRPATVTTLQSLPYVDSEYSRRFRFDSADNPKLKELRERHRLDVVIAPGRDEFERQVLLNDWAHRRFTKFGQPTSEARGALEILKAIDEGHTFFCKQYEEVFVSEAASLGWVSRPLALRRHRGNAKVGGSTEHSVTELWSNQHRKWIMFDPTSNLHIERDGVPLNAYEIRQEWFYQGGTNLVLVVGREQKQHRKSDLPILLNRFPGFGELAYHPDEPDKYGFIGYIPNNDLMDRGYDYGAMFIVQDALCEGTSWHVRKLPEHPATDPYFPVGQAAVELRPSGDKLEVTLRTFTPNFQRFEVRLDRGEWHPTEPTFTWNPHPGANQLEARTVNRFGIQGPTSSAAVKLE